MKSNVKIVITALLFCTLVFAGLVITGKIFQQLAETTITTVLDGVPGKK